jgi:hypothetical protein
VPLPDQSGRKAPRVELTDATDPPRPEQDGDPPEECTWVGDVHEDPVEVDEVEPAFGEVELGQLAHEDRHAGPLAGGLGESRRDVDPEAVHPSASGRGEEPAVAGADVEEPVACRKPPQRADHVVVAP